MKYILVVAIAFLTSLSVQAQIGEYNYKWILDKEEVGELNVVTQDVQGVTKIDYNSVLEVNIGEKVVINDVFKNVFFRDSLINVGVARYFNDKPRITILESIEDEKLVRTINGTNKPVNRSVEVFTYAKLFVEAPKDVTSLYYGIYGKMFKISEVKENVYELEGPNHRNERFTYNEKGQLVSAEVESNFGTYLLTKE